MRIAVFSDVHGNLTGLTAVLDAIHRLGVDRTVFAGDLCFMGPRPAACLTAMQQLDIDVVYGNTDEWVIGRQPPPEKLKAAAAWTLAQLSDEQRKWLARQSFYRRISPTSNPAHDLLIVHANPVDVHQIIYPSESWQYKQFGLIRQPDSALSPLLGETTANTIAFGHLHIPNKRYWQNKVLMNISSVSLPGDNDQRAKFGLFTWRNGRWQIELHHVLYDVAAEIQAYQTIQPPGWETAVKTLMDNG
ncbi:MAG: metallophosphoesterase family protein [Candidatus Promineifilaceae bacterium]